MIRNLVLSLLLLPSFLAAEHKLINGLIEDIGNLSCTSKQELVAQVGAILNNKARSLEREICTLCGWTDDRYAKGLQEEFQRVYSEPHDVEQLNVTKKHLKWTEPDPRLLRLTKETLEEFGVNPSMPIFAGGLQQSGGYAGVFVNFLILNNSFLTKLSDHAIRGIMAHEVQHIIFQDNVVRSVLDNQVMQGENKKEEAGSLFTLLLNVQELRADVFAALKSPYYALCTEHFLVGSTYDSYWTKIILWDAEDLHHPTEEQRLRVAKIIHNHLRKLGDASDIRQSSLTREMQSYRSLYWLRHGGRYVIPFTASLGLLHICVWGLKKAITPITFLKNKLSTKKRMARLRELVTQ